MEYTFGGIPTYHKFFQKEIFVYEVLTNWLVYFFDGQGFPLYLSHRTGIVLDVLVGS